MQVKQCVRRSAELRIADTRAAANLQGERQHDGAYRKFGLHPRLTGTAA